MDIDIEFRVPKPSSSKGSYSAWANQLKERLSIDPSDNPFKRSFHTEGKMFGLTFNENWCGSKAFSR